MSAILDISEYELPEDLGMLKGVDPDEDFEQEAFWAVMIGDLEHEEDV